MSTESRALEASEPLRILLAHSFYRIPGGEDRYVRRQLQLLSETHIVELLEARNEQLSDSVGTATRMIYSPMRAREATSVITRFAPDIVHLHNVYPSFGPAVHLAAARVGAPLVMTVHNYRLRCPNGLRFTEGSLCGRCERGNYLQALVHDCLPTRKQGLSYAGSLWLHRFVARLEKRVALFICPSEFVRTQCVDWGLPEDRLLTIPHFVYPSPGSNPEPGVFGVYVGRLSREKGVDVLLRALRLAGDPPFRIVGDGPVAGELRSGAAKLGLKRTEFLGSLTHDGVAETLRESRFLVVPSVMNETAGLAGLEAMALGRPLLVTSLGALPELVREGTGLICRPGDPADMAVSIVRLMEDEQYCREAGALGLSLTRDQLGPEAHLRRLESAYRSCLGLSAGES